MILELDCNQSDVERRKSLFHGDILLFSASAAMTELCTHARSLIEDTFGTDAEHAQFQMDVAEFVAKAGPLKSHFTNDQVTKSLVRNVLEEFGCELEKTYFDVPRLRVVTSNGYLTAGVGYAYQAHRDTWYSSPDCQVNWWAPVYSVTNERSLAFYPRAWDRPVANSSGKFDYDEWCRVGRTQASSQGTVDTRKHPLPLLPLDPSEELRVCMGAAEAVLFAGAHLHATVANTSGTTRFSLDFRTVNEEDLRSGAGAPNLDCQARGTTLGDFLRASDLSPISSEWTCAATRRAA